MAYRLYKSLFSLIASILLMALSAPRPAAAQTHELFVGSVNTDSIKLYNGLSVRCRDILRSDWVSTRTASSSTMA